MTEALNFECDQHSTPFECPDALLCRSTSGDFGLVIHDGGNSWVSISHCPFCGSSLGDSERPTPEQRYAIVRVDLEDAAEIQDDLISVKEVVSSQSLAEAEVKRLNELNSDRGCHYFACPTRLFAPGTSAGSGGS